MQVRLCDGTLTERARLSDIVAQTRPEDGIQPHGSWWVSRRAMRRLGKRSGREALQLSDDSQVPVARGRVEDVRDWIEPTSTTSPEAQAPRTTGEPVPSRRNCPARTPVTFTPRRLFLI
ncbi:response regulator receiver protein [Citreicella sp. SE45]|nr:response regulator receiver protein [Citreicella sp. SE45]